MTLQKNRKLVILDNFAMPGHTHLKWQWRNLWCFSASKKPTSFFLLDITKFLFWVLWASLVMHIQKIYYHFVENFRIYLEVKKKKSSPVFFWRYWKDIQTLYFEYFGYAWLDTHDMIESTCRKFSCFSTWMFLYMSKINFIFSLLPWDFTF